MVLAEAIKEGFCRKLRHLNVEIGDPRAFKSLCDALNSTSTCPRLDQLVVRLRTNGHSDLILRRPFRY